MTFVLAPKMKKSYFVCWKSYIHNTILACPIWATVISWSFKMPARIWLLLARGKWASACLAPCHAVLQHGHFYSNGNQYSFMQASSYIIVRNGFSMNFSIRGSSAWWSRTRMVRVNALDIQFSLRNLTPCWRTAWRPWKCSILCYMYLLKSYFSAGPCIEIDNMHMYKKQNYKTETQQNYRKMVQNELQYSWKSK